MFSSVFFFFFLTSLVVVGFVSADSDGFSGNFKPKYSSYECFHTGDKDTPETRTCRFKNVCFGEDGRWRYYYKRGTELSEADRAFLSEGPVVSYGPLERHALKFTLLDYAAPMEQDQLDKKAAIVCSSSATSYAHWTLDDLFATQWLFAFHDEKDPGVLINHETGLPNAKDTDIIQMCKISKHASALNPLFTDHKHLTIKGPAGHFLLRNPEKSTVTLDDINNFRKFMYRATEKPLQKPSKVLLVHDFNGRQITNVFELTESLAKEKVSAELALMNQLSFSSRVDLVSSAAMFVSLHSEEVANIVFLQENTTLFEVFPYGYISTTYKTIAEKCGLNYVNWQSGERSYSKFYPDVLNKYGIYGEDRDKIVNANGLEYVKENVAAGKAYWENQDTKVDGDVISDIIRRELDSLTVDGVRGGDDAIKEEL